MENLLTRKNFWIITCNSIASYVLAYLIVFYLTQFCYLLACGVFSYPITLTYADYRIHIEPFEWTHDSVFLTYFGSSLSTLALGIIATLGFYAVISDPLPIKVFFLWLMFHSYSYFFADIMIGNLLTDGIGHAFNWMYLPETIKMIISLLGFFGIIAVTLMMPKRVALSSDAYFSKYTEKNSAFFITAQVLVPFAIGSILLFFYFFPKNMFHEKYIWIMYALMAFVYFYASRTMDDLSFEEDDERKIKPMKNLILFTISFYIISRIVLNWGILFSWGK